MMMHLVETGTVAEWAEIAPFDFIDSVDGRGFQSVEALYANLSDAVEEQRDVTNTSKQEPKTKPQATKTKAQLLFESLDALDEDILTNRKGGIRWVPPP